jgi:hypothetical protein
MLLSHNLDDDWDDLINEVIDRLRDALEDTDEDESSLDPTAITLEQRMRATTSIRHRFANETGDIVWHSLTLFFDTTRSLNRPALPDPESDRYGAIYQALKSHLASPAVSP